MASAEASAAAPATATTKAAPSSGGHKPIVPSPHSARFRPTRLPLQLTPKSVLHAHWRALTAAVTVAAQHRRRTRGKRFTHSPASVFQPLSSLAPLPATTSQPEDRKPDTASRAACTLQVPGRAAGAEAGDDAQLQPVASEVSLGGAGEAPVVRLTSKLSSLHRRVRHTAASRVKRISERPARLLSVSEQGTAPDMALDAALGEVCDEEGQLLLHVRDEITDGSGRVWLAVRRLGCGTFGQVFKVRNKLSDDTMALKVIKALPAYTEQAKTEVIALRKLERAPLNAAKRAGDAFVNHMDTAFMLNTSGHNILCILVDLCGESLFDRLQRTVPPGHHRPQGFALDEVRLYCGQILAAVRFLHANGVVHADLKPENVLTVVDPASGHPYAKLIDFGSSIVGNVEQPHFYIQSRFYRAPEVLVGKKSQQPDHFHFDGAIDMWSLGCIAAELFTGEPLFQGSCHSDQLRQIESLMGPLPTSLLADGHLTEDFYHRFVPADSNSQREHYRLLHPVEHEATALYFNHKYEPPQPSPRSRLNLDCLQAVALRNRADLFSTAGQRLAFADLLRGLLQLEPDQRWTAEQASCHPFWRRQDLPSNQKFSPPDRSTLQEALRSETPHQNSAAIDTQIPKSHTASLRQARASANTRQLYHPQPIMPRAPGALLRHMSPLASGATTDPRPWQAPQPDQLLPSTAAPALLTAPLRPSKVASHHHPHHLVATHVPALIATPKEPGATLATRATSPSQRLSSSLSEHAKTAEDLNRSLPTAPFPTARMALRPITPNQDTVVTPRSSPTLTGLGTQSAQPFSSFDMDGTFKASSQPEVRHAHHAHLHPPASLPIIPAELVPESLRDQVVCMQRSGTPIYPMPMFAPGADLSYLAPGYAWRTPQHSAFAAAAIASAGMGGGGGGRDVAAPVPDTVVRDPFSRRPLGATMYGADAVTIFLPTQFATAVSKPSVATAASQTKNVKET